MKIKILKSIFTFHFHSWKCIQLKRIKCFLGKEYINYDDTGLRMCKKCGTIQEHSYDSQGGVWYDLSEPKQTIASNEIMEIDNRFIMTKDPHSKQWCEEIKNKI